MKIILKNSRAGAVFFAVCAVAALVLGPVNTVRRELNQVQRLFTQGQAGDGVGVAADLDTQADCAANLAVIGAKYTPAEELSRQARQAAAGVHQQTDLLAKSQAAQAAGELFDALDACLSQLELAEQDAAYCQSLRAQMNAARDTASRDPYNQAAQAYNEMAQQFPASLAAGLLQAAELPVFDG